MDLGYFLSCEEHAPNDILHQAQRAADAGMQSVWISDHYHPWLDEQAQSPFVWSVIGGIAATTSLRVTTAVTCPIIRIHPAIIAQAAATSAMMLDGRFELGVGTGEALNEHILGDRWPTTDERLEMLEEAIEVMRALWTGEQVSHRGQHFTIENAQLYSLPSQPVPVMVSAFGPKSADLASRVGDGFISTSPDGDTLKLYRSKGGKGDASAALKISWGADKQECAELAHRLWRTAGVPGELSQELRTPAHFEQASSVVTAEQMAENMPCGPDVGPIVEAVTEFKEAGFDRMYLNQIGPDQDGFFKFYESELAPALAEIGIAPQQVA
jgi:G6PDH family F420-dependent oxidoreductase